MGRKVSIQQKATLAYKSKSDEITRIKGIYKIKIERNRHPPYAMQKATQQVKNPTPPDISSKGYPQILNIQQEGQKLHHNTLLLLLMLRHPHLFKSLWPSFRRFS
jgi:hypothetical protein